MQEDLAIGIARGTCSAELMTTSACQGVFRAGREWAGWMALERGDLPEAARSVANFPDSFWMHWVAGKKAYAGEKYMDAAVQYGAAIELWKNIQVRWKANWMARLGPKPRLGLALTELGGARMLAGEISPAIATLDSAIAANPQNARAFYLRARAKELLGQQDAASTDYSLAARTAYAGAEDLVSGEGHLYRGIQAYRRKDFIRAEDEFEGALNAAALTKETRRDATAWRLLAAVSSGACGGSRGLLADALAEVSPYFPKADARSAMLACPNSF
jgi:tetratricopeptide (TPR) repeat protein